MKAARLRDELKRLDISPTIVVGTGLWASLDSFYAACRNDRRVTANKRRLMREKLRMHSTLTLGLELELSED